ncbi:aromatic compound dioxygenase [Amniculicola lignicola CBS 123094]|uniref:Aromatic compound dioxygenase n=1 Tax=Amniculicola lignicola CBS 123094 TaxID=1392246 RepID=A0A6A5WP72_9PLEO|nr:aromatic compound dioxygenase [Amniculicola lignicola CBS 123094]
MKSGIVTAILSAALLSQEAIAHPGHDHTAEIAQRNAYLKHNKRSLAHCADSLKKRGNDAMMNARRSAIAGNLRKKRSIDQEKSYLRARDAAEVLATNHASNLTGITVDSDPSVLFTGNNSCILTPETTQGPYWVSGELVRENITEGQAGVPLTLDIQIIDVNTCEPVPQAYLEIWHCNSTGVYSGVNANGNGNTDDTSNIDSTFMRGVQQSDDSGVVTFDTLVPGHYTGRTNHIHVMTHLNSTVLANNTLSGGSITHVGQMFFDQSLVTLVEAVEPYSANTQELTTNAEDSIFSQESEGVDPVVEYVLLGDDVSAGIFAWIAFGMDATAAYNITPAAYLTEDGGVENENSQGGGPGGAPPSGFPSGFPSGAIPTGTAASGVAAVVSSASSSFVTSFVSSSAGTPSGIDFSGPAPSGAMPSGVPSGKGSGPRPSGAKSAGVKAIGVQAAPSGANGARPSDMPSVRSSDMPSGPRPSLPSGAIPSGPKPSGI